MQEPVPGWGVVVVGPVVGGVSVGATARPVAGEIMPAQRLRLARLAAIWGTALR
ncbi:hypothetical protein B0I31_13231, partial [Saccharothrix carnea]